MSDYIGKKILIIESDYDFIKEIEKSLRRVGYRILYSQDGVEGLEKVYKENPDLILCGWEIPRLSGMEICTLMKRDIRTKQIPFVFCMKTDELENNTQAFKTEADDYLFKELSDNELYSKLENIFKRFYGMTLFQSGVSGQLEQMNLINIIQLFDMNNKSGVAYITNGIETGKIIINDVDINRAICATKTDAEALEHMLRWQKGDFSFKFESITSTESLKIKPITSVESSSYKIRTARGYNDEVEYQENVYHIQTEDLGKKRAIIVSTIFLGGRSIVKRELNYNYIKDEKDLIELIAPAMLKLHKKMVKDLEDGEFDEEINLTYT